MDLVTEVLVTSVAVGACGVAAAVLEFRLSPRFLAGAPPRAGLVALVAAAVAAVVAAAVGPRAELPAYAALVVTGVVLARIDLAVHRLPDVLTRATLAAGAVLLLAAAVVEGRPGHLVSALAGAAGLWLVYRILAVLSRGGLGRGDVKLAPALGLYAGWLGLQAWEVAALGGFLLQGVTTLALLLARRVDRRSDVAHGPAMLLATLAAVVAAPVLADAYVRVLGRG